MVCAPEPPGDLEDVAELVERAAARGWLEAMIDNDAERLPDDAARNRGRRATHRDTASVGRRSSSDEQSLPTPIDSVSAAVAVLKCAAVS
jgi:hypothetical protein